MYLKTGCLNLRTINHSDPMFLCCGVLLWAWLAASLAYPLDASSIPKDVATKMSVDTAKYPPKGKVSLIKNRWVKHDLYFAMIVCSPGWREHSEKRMRAQGIFLMMDPDSSSGRRFEGIQKGHVWVRGCSEPCGVRECRRWDCFLLGTEVSRMEA